MEIIDARSLKSIDKPGIYAELDAGIYHSKLTPTQSLSSSMARTLINECPAMLYARSALNPDYVREEKAVFDIGSAVHLLYLEEEKFEAGVAVLDFDDWRKKDAQIARDEAREAGRIPLLKKQADELMAMRKALLLHPIAGKAFSGKGHSELSMVWKDPETGVWLKARPDWSPSDFSFLIDMKTSTTANPVDFARKAFNLGYHQQAAWYLDAVELVTGERPGKFWFVAQDKSAPYLCSVSSFDEDAIIAGREQNRKAIRRFADCLEKNNWPGYRNDATPHKDSAFILTLPVWAQRQVENLIATE